MKAVTSMVFAGVLGVGSLVAQPAHAQCTTDVECKGSRVCRQGVCSEPTQACRTDVDCPASLVCSAGACSASGAPGPAAPQQTVMVPGPSAPQQTVLVPGSPPPLVPRQGDVPYRTETRGIRGLVIAGSIVFGLAYLTGISVTAALGADGDLVGFATIPVAGPWIMLGDHRTSSYSAALASNGILQAGGLSMFVIGLAVRREHQVPVYASEDGSVRVGVSTVPLAGGSLVSASGQF